MINEKKYEKIRYWLQFALLTLASANVLLLQNPNETKTVPILKLYTMEVITLILPFLILTLWAYQNSLKENYSSLETAFKKIRDWQREILLSKPLDHLNSFLEHENELQLIIKELQHNPTLSKNAFLKYAHHTTSQKTMEECWFLAAELGNLAVIQAIVDSNLLSDLNTKNYEGNTAAHIAVMNKKLKVLNYFKQLHDSGLMNLGLRNKYDQTPQDLLDKNLREINNLLKDIPTEQLLNEDQPIERVYEVTKNPESQQETNPQPPTNPKEQS